MRDMNLYRFMDKYYPNWMGKDYLKPEPKKKKHKKRINNSKEWKILRAKILKERGQVCEECDVFSKTLHHKKNKED